MEEHDSPMSALLATGRKRANPFSTASQVWKEFKVLRLSGSNRYYYVYLNRLSSWKRGRRKRKMSKTNQRENSFFSQDAIQKMISPSAKFQRLTRSKLSVSLQNLRLKKTKNSISWKWSLKKVIGLQMNQLAYADDFTKEVN